MTPAHVVSLTLLVAATVWDAYAQCKGLPYSAPSWLVGAMLYPFGETAYSALKKIPAKIKSFLPTGAKK